MTRAWVLVGCFVVVVAGLLVGAHYWAAPPSKKELPVTTTETTWVVTPQQKFCGGEGNCRLILPKMAHHG